ncbi:hypothetical protein RirG_063320 [Rhizophagus irregularis DAOM 197198w]|uniref:Uncharacterized protein n=1 Tax=Rhizophagus irregularis (strain DAOM 197198w) TaxID=1432141 RepID=A0A015KZU5_RHIIW|nr:hypothetical protein RirG_063320 [Rhizophagus irregularis DAOM 197198w]
MSEEWVKQERDILKLRKLNIDSPIYIPNEINILNELSKALKTHSTFEIYKNCRMYRLDQMSFQGDKDDALNFLSTFVRFVLKVKIINPQEIKNHLLETYSSNEFFKHEFPKRISGITSMNEIYRLYSEMV